MATPDRSRRLALASTAVGVVAVVGLGVVVIGQVMSDRAELGSTSTSIAAQGASSQSPAPAASPKPQSVVSATPVQPTARGARASAGAGGAVPPAWPLAGQAERLASQLPTTPAAPAPFRVASFNMLGNSHTVGRHARPGFADGGTRAAQAAEVTRSLGLDVVGAQEFEPRQQKVFRNRLPGFAAFPGTSRSFIEATNSIMWNTTKFRLVRAELVDIPYFGGNPVRMPYVLLEQLSSGRQVWVANFHNPADVHGPAQRWREQATVIEAQLARQLSADGTPVIMTGDFNERGPFFCRLTARTPGMKSASGATAGPPCSVPKHAQIDWVLGSVPVAFSNYSVVDGGLVDRATDHPVVLADVTLPPATQR